MQWLIVIVAAIFWSALRYSSFNILWCVVMWFYIFQTVHSIVWSSPIWGRWTVQLDYATLKLVGFFHPFSLLFFSQLLFLSWNYKVLCSSIIYCRYQLSALLSGSPLIWWKWNQKRTLFWCGWILMAGRCVPCRFVYVAMRKRDDKPIYLIILFNYWISRGTTRVFRLHIRSTYVRGKTRKLVS